MRKFVDNQIIETIRELQDLINFLEAELEVAGTHGEFDRADQIAVELFDARKELNKIEAQF